MAPHRTPEEVKRFDTFKIITFAILVILLLFGWSLFRPVENPPASAQVTTEPAATPTSTATEPENSSAPTQAVENPPASAQVTTEPAATPTSTATEPENSSAPTEAPIQMVESPPTVAQATTEPTAEIPPTSAATTESAEEANVAAPTINLPGGEVTPGEVMLSGTGEPGSEIEIVVDGQVVGQTTVNSDGTWDFAAALPEVGDYQVSVQSLDSNGQVLAASEAVTLTLTAAEATATVMTLPTLELPGEGITANTGQVELSGTGEPGAEVEIVADGQVVGKTTVGSDGKWSFTADLPPRSQPYQLSVQSIDAAGKVLAASESVPLTVVAPVSAAAAPTLDLPTGKLTTGSITVSGNGEPGSQIQVLVDGQPVGTTAVDSNGKWSLPFDLTDAGDYEIMAQSVDTAGQVTASSKPAMITVTSTDAAAAAPTSSTPGDGQAYIVQADDWLSKLSLKFYNDIAKYPVIVEATNAMAKDDSTFTVITNPDLIEIGQKLWIPAAAP